MLAAISKRLDRTSGTPLLLDEFLPTYDVTQRRHVVVDADPETTYEAVLTADLTDTGPLVAALSWLRLLPERVLATLGLGPAPDEPEALTFGDVAETEGWLLLAEDPGRELVMGAVGRFWEPVIEWVALDAASFAAFDDPGYAKLAMAVVLQPYGEGRTLVTYEARTATTDADARAKFRRYWRLVGPFAGYLMDRTLARIRTDAEAAAGRAESSGSRAVTDQV